MRTIVRYEMTCGSCPTQYDLWTDTGDYVYFRYRWGRVQIDLNHQNIYEKQFGDDLDGSMSINWVKTHLGEAGFDTSRM